MLKMLVMSTFLLFSANILSADINALMQEFNAAKTQLNRVRGNERKSLIQKKLLPILKKISDLKSDEAVLFLGKVVNQEQPELSSAACRPLAATGNPKAVLILLQAVEKRPPQVRKDAMAALWQEKAAVKAIDEAAMGKVKSIVVSRQKEDVRQEGIRVLAAPNNMTAAKNLVQILASRGLTEDLGRQVESSLAGFKDDAILTYLFTDALETDAKTPRQIIALLNVAARKKDKRAKAAATSMLAHKSTEVAGAAVSYLAAVGIEGGQDQVIKLLKKVKRNPENALDLLINLAESGTPAAGGLLVQVSRTFEGPLRAAAVSLLGRIKSDAALTRVIEVMEDPDISVRTASLRAAQQFKDKRIIGPLIAMMGREQGRLQGEALQHLIKITGQNMGLVVSDWKKWWAYAKNNFDFKPKAAGKTAVKAVDYYGIEIFSNRICFILDRSSSMKAKAKDHETKQQSTRVALAKKELIKTLQKLKPGSMVNIITFDANFSPMAKQLTPLTRAGRAKAIRFVQTLKTGSGTNIYDTLSAALKDRRVDTIFLLSDGQPSRGKYTNTTTILREIRKQNLTRNVTINTIAIGDERLDFMKGLAKENGGTYIFVKD